MQHSSDSDADLWTCTECHLSPDPTWDTITFRDGLQYHMSFDSIPCGPIVANPAVPAKRLCEWWRWDGCAHDPSEPGCTWPNCPLAPNT